MQRIKYAVVSAFDKRFNVQKEPERYCFTKFHDTQEEAVEEAERLARKEQSQFLILKLAGFVEPETIPIRKEIWA